MTLTFELDLDMLKINEEWKRQIPRLEGVAYQMVYKGIYSFLYSTKLPKLDLSRGSKIILAAKIILFHFRRGSVQH